MFLTSCATTNSTFNKKEYRKSKTLVTYTGMGNEFQDGYLVLKENNYFKFYLTFWLIVTIKQVTYTGRYSQKDDMLYLNWGTDPKQIKPYLSGKCVLDSSKNSLWFIDDATNKRLWGLGAMKNK